MAPAIAGAYRATAEVESIEDDPMLVCDEGLAAWRRAWLALPFPVRWYSTTNCT